MSKMRKTLLTILLATALTATGQKYVGGDISMLTKYEEAGVVYKDKDGNAVLVAGHDDMVVANRTAGLGNVFYATLVSPLNVVAEGEESVRA